MTTGPPQPQNCPLCHSRRIKTTRDAHGGHHRWYVSCDSCGASSTVEPEQAPLPVTRRRTRI